MRRVWPLLGVNKARLALAIALGSLTLMCAVGLAATAAWLIARSSQMPPVLELTVAAVSVRAFGIGRATFRYLDRLASHDVALRGGAVLRTRLYGALACGRVDAVAGLRRGELLRRWGSDVDDLGDLVVRGVVPTGVALVVSVASVALLAALSGPVGAVLAAALAGCGVLVPLLTVRAVRATQLADGRARGAVFATTQTVLDGAPELLVGGRLEATLGALADAEADVRRARDRAARPAALAEAVTLAATGVVVVAALAIGSAQLGDTVSATALAVLVLTPLAAFEGVQALAPATVAVVRAADAATRVDDLLTRAGSTTTGTALPYGQTVRASGLAVGWPGADPLLSDLDLEVAPGSSLVLLGANGCGKSTLLATLAGLLPPVAGQVQVGGVATSELAPGAAAHVVTLTAEDAHLFDTTILENLRVARGDVTEIEAVQALRDSGLGSLLAQLPEGVHAPVGAGGARLSGGERRRLLLARALLTRAPVLLLDEPDEHLDPETAQTLLRDVLALASAGRGVVVVTHRRTADLSGADRVLDLGTVPV